MVIVASIYLRFYMEVRVGVGTFLPTPTPPKIPSDSDSAALVTNMAAARNFVVISADLMLTYFVLR
jgi:hypothetical protein